MYQLDVDLKYKMSIHDMTPGVRDCCIATYAYMHTEKMNDCFDHCSYFSLIDLVFCIMHHAAIKLTKA